MLPKTTLCLLVKDDQVLLAMKKRGFGLGKWNGYGGKPHPGETIEQTAAREMEEEIGVKAAIEDLERVARLKFYFKDKAEWDQEVSIYLVRNWQGEPRETDEMRPQWFKHSQIPFDGMWPDDQHWLPRVLAGEKLTGEFYFLAQDGRLESFQLRTIEV